MAGGARTTEQTERCSAWQAAWDGQLRPAGAVDAGKARPRRKRAAERHDDPQDGRRPGGEFRLSLLAITAAAITALASGWAPLPRVAMAMETPDPLPEGAFRGECRSGETGKLIPLSIVQGAEGPELRWSRYSYPLKHDQVGAWTAYRGAEAVGVVRQGEGVLEVRMRNFRCQWIEATPEALRI